MRFIFQISFLGPKYAIKIPTLISIIYSSYSSPKEPLGSVRNNFMIVLNYVFSVLLHHPLVLISRLWLPSRPTAPADLVVLLGVNDSLMGKNFVAMLAASQLCLGCGRTWLG